MAAVCRVFSHPSKVNIELAAAFSLARPAAKLVLIDKALISLFVLLDPVANILSNLQML